MKQNNTVLLVVVALVLIGAGAFFMSQRGGDASVASRTQSGNEQMAESGGGMMGKSLMDLLKSGVAQKCTFSSETEGTSVEGVTYMSGGNVRSDYSTSDGTTDVSGHVIVSDSMSYMWMDGEENGVKMKIDPEEYEEGVAKMEKEQQSMQSFDMNAQMDYNCSPWVVDGGMFTPPANVQFADMSAMMESMMGGEEGDTSAACAVCDSLSGEEQSQCKTALNCN